MLTALLALVGDAPPDITGIKPAPNLPGSDVVANLAKGIGYIALVAALAGMLISAAMWAIGHHSSNYQQATNGRRGVLVSALAALIIGAAPFLVQSFYGIGGSTGHP